eukprot:1634993-Rhodomonas_salina.2
MHRQLFLKNHVVVPAAAVPGYGSGRTPAGLPAVGEEHGVQQPLARDVVRRELIKRHDDVRPGNVTGNVRRRHHNVTNPPACTRRPCGLHTTEQG